MGFGKTHFVVVLCLALWCGAAHQRSLARGSNVQCSPKMCKPSTTCFALFVVVPTLLCLSVTWEHLQKVTKIQRYNGQPTSEFHFGRTVNVD